MKPTIVIGHKNPDTDSICSAICYADFKQKTTGETYIPCRAGEIHAEARYVLETFGAQEPQYISSLEPRLSDVQYRTVEGIDKDLSLKRAWQRMRDDNIQTLAVLDENKKLEGILSLGDVARFYIEDQDAGALAAAKTSYRNIVDALNGELVVGDPEDCFTKGKIVVAAANPDKLEEYIKQDDMVILGNRYESQLCSIEMRAGCIVIGLDAKVSRTIRKLAQQAHCAVIVTPMDTYTCAKIINQAVPVSYVMRSRGVVSFHDTDLAEDVKASVSKKRMRYFPILDNNEQYIGMVSQRNLLDMSRQKVIMVDHNERDQAVDGIWSADIMEIIDHHRIDTIETSKPIYFCNRPLGCTATIIALLYQEYQIAIEPQIAGLLCSAILSDTLMFRSPTCTPTDQRIAEMLAKLAGIDIQSHADAMFHAGSHIGDKSADEIFHMDYKRYQAGKKVFAVSQVQSVNQEELQQIKQDMLPYLKNLLPTSGLDMLFLMLTDIIQGSTELLFVGKGTKEVVTNAFAAECETDHTIFLPGVVSRKKQMMIPLISSMEELFG